MLKEFLLRNWKTSAAGLVTGFATLLVNYGIDLSPAAQAKLTELIMAAGITLIGFFSKDGNVSGKA